MESQTEAQISIDFLVGIVIFLGAIFFVFQFLSVTVLPFAQGTDEKTVTVNRVSDSLVYDKMATGEKGVIDLTYLYNESRDEVKSEDEILKDLNVNRDRHSLNMTVVDEEGVDESNTEVVRINGSGLVDTGTFGDGEPVQIGREPLKGSINKATRIGYVKNVGGAGEPKTVVVRIRMW